MKIGIFDSGIGGLSVLHLALKYLPNEQFIYYADESHVPYGEKTKEEIIGYVDEAIQLFIRQGTKAIVIACNTATSAAIEVVREKYSLPIIGMEPAIKKALDLYGEKRVLVAATPVTVCGKKMRCLMEKVDHEHLVDLLALPKLVRFAENEIFDTEEVRSYLKDELKEYSLEEYSSIVLGCTHFNYFKRIFREILPDYMHFVDGNDGTVHRLIHEIGVDLDSKNQAFRKMTEAQLKHVLEQVKFYESGVLIEERSQCQYYERMLARLEEMLQID